jgi:hypothetical protein
MTAMKTTLTYEKAMASMRRPGTRLVKMHGGRDAGFYVVPGGRVEDSVAAKIMAHPLVRGGRDALWPGLDQSWRMIDSRQAGAS